VTCRSSACQAARTYSLIRPLRTGFRRICRVDVGHARGVSVTFIVGDALGDALVRPGGVVVLLILHQDCAQMLLPENQETGPGARGAACR